MSTTGAVSSSNPFVSASTKILGNIDSSNLSSNAAQLFDSSFNLDSIFAANKQSFNFTPSNEGLNLLSVGEIRQLIQQVATQENKIIGVKA